VHVLYTRKSFICSVGGCTNPMLVLGSDYIFPSRSSPV